MFGLLLCVLSFVGFRVLLALGYTLEFAQGAAATGLLFGLLTRAGRRLVPVAVTLFSAVLLFTFFSSAGLRLQNVVLVAPSPNDAFGVAERRLRHAIEDGRVSARVATFERFPQDEAELQRAVEQRRNVSFAILPEGEWLRVVVRREGELPLRALAPWLGSTRLAELAIIRDVGGFRISREPRIQTGEFLATVARGFSAESEAEELLASSANIVAPWRNFAHRAYPLWVAANRRLEQALEGESRGELRCAIREYGRALKYVRTNEGPNLRAAIINNLVVAKLIQREFRPRPKKRGLKKLGRIMRDALKVVRGPHREHVLTDVRARVTENTALLQAITEDSKARRKGRKLKHGKRRKR